MKSWRFDFVRVADSFCFMLQKNSSAFPNGAVEDAVDSVHGAINSFSGFTDCFGWAQIPAVVNNPAKVLSEEISGKTLAFQERLKQHD
jgi:hypothetical protein